MKKTPLFVVLFLLVSIPGLYVAKKMIPVLKNRAQQETSDAKDLKGKITLAIDDWIGYYPISSARMKKAMRNEGYILDIANDGGDYPARMKKLRDGDLNFAVVTVDSYILNAAALDFPATIVAILDESKGGDAMVAYTNVVSSLDSFKGFNAANMPRIAYTPSSPSQHLLKAISSHFNVPALKNLSPAKRVETKDSQEALKDLQAKNVSVAVLWEPNVSKALEIPGVAKILGTESTSRLIVDILVVNRDFAQKNPQEADLLLKTYFRTLKFYADNPDELAKDIESELKISGDSVKKMLNGVAWVNLSDNCQEWFGITGPGQAAEQGLVDTIGSTVDILVQSGDFKDDPLPDKDPYRIVNSSFIQKIYNEGIKNGFATLTGGAGRAAELGDGLSRPFKPLTDAQWANLRPVGSLNVEPILFQSGASDLEVSEKEKLDVMVSRLKHYPTFRILVEGHTSFLGDADANLALSQERAEAVVRYLAITYAIDANRIRAVGYGGTRPLAMQPGESERAYQTYRLPRVEVSLLSESF
ncbi:MAG TPA: phosphate ABC transporter substrate-binding/OmpA family protein [Verrucomicrobiae bacterium]|jgi:outer membrane protein OmpA-like peptidoglycan-associated protein/ABC-type nitrate/sulfonate/bicarbonate transport system substrate-binding protein